MSLLPHTLPGWHDDVRYGRVPSPDPDDAAHRPASDHIAFSISAHHLGYNHHDTPTLSLLIDPDGAQIVGAQWVWVDGRPSKDADVGRLPLWGLALISRLALRVAYELGMKGDWGGSGWWLADGDDDLTPAA